MTTLPFTMIVLCTSALLLPGVASAQQRPTTVAPLFADAGPSFAAAAQQPSNVPPEVKQAETAVKRAVRRYRIGVFGGVALDPELIEFGAHGAFGPFFGENIEFRPGFDLGVGEVTTQFGINLDVIYIMSQTTTTNEWSPYLGIGANFGFSHQSFEGEDEESGNRFDFGDTDVEGGMNFIVGMRKQSGLFFEMRATAYGVSAIRLLGGFNF
jgi:hypothetical protein